MIYLLDSNIFITPANTFYRFAFGMNFWNFLVDKAENGKLASLDKVKEEINRCENNLKEWANNYFSNYFLNTKDPKVIQKYSELMRWAESKNNHYTRNAIDEFMKEDNADPWLIAFALSKKENYKIVTFEKFNKDQKNRIPIPNVCKEFNLYTCDLYQMLKDLNFKEVYYETLSTKYSREYKLG
ncbi:MAG TPA: DUF4411 family protein [Spirochaetota bacterium]|nr:DUF4411 family protein [Spirochaetota bacterium]HOM39108.1 DUF4411 family protein [Spirochaetota bacterium]HPQ49601.1 DUF4411 family protein [Spirochaetota bacterium]